MCRKKDFLYFLAGAVAMHTVSHLAAGYAGILPMTVWGINVTPQLNSIITAVSAALTLGLLYFAQADKNDSCETPEIKK